MVQCETDKEMRTLITSGCYGKKLIVSQSRSRPGGKSSTEDIVKKATCIAYSKAQMVRQKGVP